MHVVEWRGKTCLCHLIWVRRGKMRIIYHLSIRDMNILISTLTRITCWEMYNLITKQVSMKKFIWRSWSGKVLVIDIWIFRGIYSDEIIFPGMFLKSFSYHVSMSAINLWYSFKKKLVLIKEFIFKSFSARIYLVFSLPSTLWIILSWLITLCPHYILDPVFHLCQIIPSSIKFLNTY